MKERVIRIDQDGIQTLTFTPEKEASYTFHIDKHRNANLCITYSGKEAHLTQKFICEEGASLHVLIQNEMETLHLEEETTVYKDAHITIGYLELNDGVSIAKCSCVLKETGASARLMNSCITSGTKQYQVECVHEQPYTKGTIENYAVVKEHGKYTMQACGKIVKGAHSSESHQASRVLTLSEQQESIVIPLLLIDENEVKASHATTVGQPDENQLYYLQTRGLTRNQALGLLTIGYLLPITEILEDQELALRLKNEIETKVGLHV